MERNTDDRGGIVEGIESILATYDDVMTADEVSHVLRVTPKCVRDMCVSEQLRGIKVGRYWRIPKPALVDYMSGAVA